MFCAGKECVVLISIVRFETHARNLTVFWQVGGALCYGLLYAAEL